MEAVKRASIRLDRSEENIAGVLIPNLSIRENREADDSDSGMSQIGLDRGGVAIQNCREKFRAILTNLVEIASMQVRIRLRRPRS
jgi:V-type H+-transporting ATPase subunit D